MRWNSIIARFVFLVATLLGVTPLIAQSDNGYVYPPASQQPVARANYQLDPEPQNYRPRSTATKSNFPSLQPRTQSEASEAESENSSLGPMVTTGASLAVVLGLFAGLVWITRRYGNGSMTQTGIPSDVMTPLGSTMIDARTRVTLLRCGQRIIVMAQTANGIHPLSEITDSAEVARLTAACAGESPASFADTLRQVDASQAAHNDLGGRLFASA